MRRSPRGHSKFDIASALGVVVALCVGCGASALPLAPFGAAQANLETAMTAATSFYSSNRDSYVGIGGGAQLPGAVSSIAELDTGLTYVPGHQGSTNSAVISIYAPNRSVLVLTAYGPGLQTCWGILSMKLSRTSPYFQTFPRTARSGTFYFRKASSASTHCAAARILPSVLSTSGFPAA